MKQQGISGRLKLILLIFYLLILLLPVITYFSVYSQTLHLVTDKEMESQQMLADSAMSQLLSSLQYADNYTDSLTSITETANYLSNTGKDTARLVSAVRSLHDTFPIFSDANGILGSPVLYSASSRTMADRQSAYLNLRRYYQSILFSSDMSYQAWTEKFLEDRESVSFVKPSLESSVIVYSKRIIGKLNKGGRIFFEINAERLEELFRGTDMGTPKSLALMDRNGKLLYQSGITQDDALSIKQLSPAEGPSRIGTGKGSKVLCTSQLDDYGLTLYTMISGQYFREHAFTASFEIIQVTLPVLILILFFLILFICYSHRTLQSTAAFLPNDLQITTINPLKYFQQSVRQLSDTNRDQSLRLQQSRQEMLDATIDIMIYQGNVSSDEPLENRLARLGMPLEAEHYRAMILSLFDSVTGTPITVSEQMHTLLHDYSGRFAPSIRYLKMTGPDQMLFLFLSGSAGNRLEDLSKELSGLCWQITQTIECDVRIYIGEEHTSLNSIHFSFRTARELLVSGASANGYLVYPDESQHSPVYDYQGSDSRYLRAMTASGNREAVREHLQQLYTRNSQDNARTGFEYLLLYTHMLNNLMDSGYTSPLPDELIKSLSDLPVKRFFWLIGECYDELCVKNQNQVEIKQTRQIQEILQDLQTNYSDYNLTMTDIAMKYGMGERRLSTLIKEATGHSFPEYLEKLRINHAIEFLTTTDMAINEIATKVGYSGDQSFRRAFKRLTGKSPTDFKR